MKIFSWVNQKLGKFSRWLDLKIFQMYVRQITTLVNDRHITNASTDRFGMSIIGASFVQTKTNDIIKVYYVLANRFLTYMFRKEHQQALGLTMMSTQYAIVLVNDPTMQLNKTLSNAVVFHELGHIVKGHFDTDMLGKATYFVGDISKELEADEFAVQAGYSQQLQDVLSNAFASLPFSSKDIPALRERLIKVIEFEIDHPNIQQQRLHLLQ
jgi:hypothetical protein